MVVAGVEAAPKRGPAEEAALKDGAAAPPLAAGMEKLKDGAEEPEAAGPAYAIGTCICVCGMADLTVCAHTAVTPLQYQSQQ